jgi:hypothetical protein
MKRLLFSTLVVIISMGAIATSANAEQVSRENSKADLNGDGVVTLNELARYNRDQRDA